MRYAKLEQDGTITILNEKYIVHNGTVYTNPLHNPNLNLKEIGYKQLIVSDAPEYDEENEKVIMGYTEDENAIHRVWRIEPLTEEEKEMMRKMRQPEE